jgi:hypothetical protein
MQRGLRRIFLSLSLYLSLSLCMCLFFRSLLDSNFRLIERENSETLCDIASRPSTEPTRPHARLPRPPRDINKLPSWWWFRPFDSGLTDEKEFGHFFLFLWVPFIYHLKPAKKNHFFPFFLKKACSFLFSNLATR